MKNQSSSEPLEEKPTTEHKLVEAIFNSLNDRRAVKWEGLSDGGKWTRAIEAMKLLEKACNTRISSLESELKAEKEFTSKAVLKERDMWLEKEANLKWELKALREERDKFALDFIYWLPNGWEHTPTSILLSRFKESLENSKPIP